MAYKMCVPWYHRELVSPEGGQIEKKQTKNAYLHQLLSHPPPKKKKKNEARSPPPRCSAALLSAPKTRLRSLVKSTSASSASSGPAGPMTWEDSGTGKTVQKRRPGWVGLVWVEVGLGWVGFVWVGLVEVVVFLRELLGLIG